MAVRKSPEADDDFARIYAYGLADYGRRQAEDYALGLLEAFDWIGDHPLLARERTVVSPPVRLHIYRAHHVLYLIDDGDVLILRVLHGSANWIEQLQRGA